MALYPIGDPRRPLQLAVRLLAAITFVFSLPGGLTLPVIIVGLVVAALIQLIFHLSKSFESIRASAGDQRGFEPLPAPSPGNWPPSAPPAR
jgi:hypothetical protein